MRRISWAALAAALLVLACGAPAASADSIAYVKDGNVWLTTPDGSRQYQVTSAGGYSDVSQADDGTMIALNGVRLHRLDRATAHVIADFDTPVSDTRPAPSKTFYGPFDPAISPDGTKVAYTYYYMTQSQNPTLLPADLRGRDQRGRHGLLVRRPPDRLGRAGPRLPLGLAPPVVGRQRHDDAVEPDPPAEPRHDPRHDQRRRQRPRQHGQELDQRHGRRATRTSAAATSRATSARWRSRPARTTAR